MYPGIILWKDRGNGKVEKREDNERKVTPEFPEWHSLFQECAPQSLLSLLSSRNCASLVFQTACHRLTDRAYCGLYRLYGILNFCPSRIFQLGSNFIAEHLLSGLVTEEFFSVGLGPSPHFQTDRSTGVSQPNASIHV